MVGFDSRAAVGGVAAALVVASLAACSGGGSLVADIDGDGGLAFVAEGRATGAVAQGGIRTVDGQGIAIDPSGLGEGSLLVEILGEGDEPGGGAEAEGVLSLAGAPPAVVVFSQEVSAGDGEIVVGGIDGGYHVVTVSADRATGTMAVRPCGPGE